MIIGTSFSAKEKQKSKLKTVSGLPHTHTHSRTHTHVCVSANTRTHARAHTHTRPPVTYRSSRVGYASHQRPACPAAKCRSTPRAAVSFELRLYVLTSHMCLLINTAALPGGQKLKIILLIREPFFNPWAGSGVSLACRAVHSTICFLFEINPQQLISHTGGQVTASGKLLFIFFLFFFFWGAG